jgi:hypothetical protein
VTPGAAVPASTPSWPLRCLQRPELQLAPRETVGPSRLHAQRARFWRGGGATQAGDRRLQGAPGRREGIGHA